MVLRLIHYDGVWASARYPKGNCHAPGSKKKERLLEMAHEDVNARDGGVQSKPEGDGPT